ncbi:MAG: hypothetical protein ABJA57_06710, partial [Ginsengibacter sp.]
MQHVNDDMDELFRRAAENYPLNTNGADWDKVRDKILAAENNTPAVSPKRSSKRSLLFLLLLLPVAWIYFQLSPSHPATGITVTGEKEVSQNGQQKNVASGDKISQQNAEVTNPPGNTNKKAILSFNTAAQTSLLTPHASARSGVKVGKQVSFTTSGSKGVTVEPETSLASYPEMEEAPMKVFGFIPYAVIRQVPEQGKIAIAAPLMNEKPDKDVTEKAGLVSKSILKKDKQEKRTLYAGIIVSPDISTVKMQHVNKMGTGVGIVLGYRFDKRLSVESGILFDKKIYYSKGE